jgi:hypothetical protein
MSYVTGPSCHAPGVDPCHRRLLPEIPADGRADPPSASVAPVKTRREQRWIRARGAGAVLLGKLGAVTLIFSPTRGFLVNEREVGIVRPGSLAFDLAESAPADRYRIMGNCRRVRPRRCQ